jgi:hypothetical protein
VKGGGVASGGGGGLAGKELRKRKRPGVPR